MTELEFCQRCFGEGCLHRQDCGAHGLTMTCPECAGTGQITPSGRITGDKDRENPVEGAPPHSPMGAALIYAQKRIAALEHDLALARRGLAFAQGEQVRLMTERTDARTGSRASPPSHTGDPT